MYLIKGGTISHPPCEYIPDGKVPEKCWRDNHDLEYLPASETEPTPGQLHKIAQVAPGMGHSSHPYAVYSWDSIFNCQTTHNGGRMRPESKWQPGQPILRTRLTTPIECVRVTSLHESSHRPTHILTSCVAPLPPPKPRFPARLPRRIIS